MQAMRASVKYADYYTKVRDQVCEGCPELPQDHHNLGPRCKGCGVVLQLPRLIESIQEASESLDECNPDPDRRTVCAQCHFLDGGVCPCPAGSLTAALVRVVKSVDECRAQREQLRLWLGHPSRKEKVPVAEMIRAYEEATGTCVGCD